MNYMEDLPGPVKSWAGESNTECLGKTALAWGDNMTISAAKVACIILIHYLVGFHFLE